MPAKLTALDVVERPVWGMIRALAPEVVEPSIVGPLVAAWRAAGVAGIDVYNYGLMPERTFQALGAALND